MKPIIKYFAVTLLCLISLNSCKTKQVKPKEVVPQTAMKDRYFQEGEKKELIQEAFDEDRKSWTALKMDWKAHVTNKKTTLSSKVRMEMARGKGLYVSVRPFPFIELARFWFLPKAVYVVNVMDQSYAKLSYKEISQELGISLDYPHIEGLLRGHFAPIGRKHKRKVKNFELTSFCTGLNLKDKQKDYVISYSLSFDFDLEYIGVRKASEELTWDNLKTNHDFFGVVYKRNKPNTGSFGLPKEETYYFNKERTRSVKLDLLKVKRLDSAKGLHLKPKLKDRYRQIDSKELKSLVKYILGKLK